MLANRLNIKYFKTGNLEARELTKLEKKKYATQITKSRDDADSYVFGYKKKEMIRGDEIITLAKGEPGVGWIVVGVCEITT